MNWKKISDGIDRFIDIVGCLMVLITILCTSINIFSRWIIGRSLGQLDEISLMAFVWAIYIGMGVLYNRNEHITMDFVVQKLSPKPRFVLIVIDTVIELCVSVLVTILAFKLMSRSFIRTTNVCHVPYAYLQLAVGLGFGHLVLCLTSKLIKQINSIVKKEDYFAIEANSEGGEA